MNKTKEASIQSLNTAFDTLKDKAIVPTQKQVSIETGDYQLQQ